MRPKQTEPYQNCSAEGLFKVDKIRQAASSENPFGVVLIETASFVDAQFFVAIARDRARTARHSMHVASECCGKVN
jgi:hypothetical protein